MFEGTLEGVDEMYFFSYSVFKALGFQSTRLSYCVNG